MAKRSRRRFIGDSARMLSAAFIGRQSQAIARQVIQTDIHRPNVLLIITDQHRIDTLGFRGLTPCRTPNLDQLANEGISFDRCLTPSPLCLPARTALFTSLYPHQTGTFSNRDTLESEALLLTRLRAQGYQTDFAGKWGMGKSNIGRWVDRWEATEREEYSRWCLEQGLPDGWAFNDPEMRSHRRDDVSIPKPAVMPLRPEQTIDAWIVDHAIQLLDTRDQSRPFFLTCSLEGPHPPFKVPEPFYSMYDSDAIPEPPNFGPSAGKPRSLGRSFYRTVWRDHGETWEAWKKSVAVYWGFVTLIDAQIGRLVERLKQEDILDSTVVIVTADHGEMLGQHGLWHKYHAYEEALRVPMIIRAPWLIEPGRRTEVAASLIDIVPTVLPICGISPPDHVQGVDLSFAFSGSAPEARRRFLFSEFEPKGNWHGVVDWRLVTDNHNKYVWNLNDLDEFYDLSTDPFELDNLARSSEGPSQPLIDKFRDELQAWMRRTNDPLVSLFEDQRGRVRA